MSNMADGSAHSCFSSSSAMLLNSTIFQAPLPNVQAVQTEQEAVANSETSAHDQEALKGAELPNHALAGGDLQYRAPTVLQRILTSWRLLRALPWRRFASGSVLVIEVRHRPLCCPVLIPLCWRWDRGAPCPVLLWGSHPAEGVLCWSSTSPRAAAGSL